ncbi:MAG: hypothetical protein B6U85_10465 [Desulfurococcales archaeon ex4484_42]|nr:MAG: hypothetical protein B6U85_10465 [Desulfurococcales archaeon ex4484_42]
MVKLIEFAMCGSEGKECNPYVLTAHLERQKLLLLINSKPLSAGDIARELGISTEEVIKHLYELARCGLVKEVNGLYRPAFAIFTLGDQRTLQPLMDDLANDIVEVIKDNMRRVRDVINDLSIVKRGIKPDDLEYVIVGAITLDYSGLDVLSEEGLLLKSKKMPGGGNYVFTGFEVGLIDLNEAWMWGHNGVFGKYWFSSHGKLPPRGRLAFPDLAWLWYGLGVSLDKVTAKMSEIGAILEALTYGDLTFKDLQSKLGINELSLATDLSLLLTLWYVTVLNRKLWRLNIPVFTPEDYGRVKTLSISILKEIASRFKSKLSIINDYYSKTSPARNEIPLKEAFNQVYHIIFEKALDKLIKDEVIKEPPLRPDGGRYSVFMIILKEAKSPFTY